ncbi:MAG: hypothetical protein HXN72_08515 [Prevotella pallens]|uniref:hypothetical protein n=1 Tax=Prevotella pallens TaxID=60133 RepID=UPI001CB18485|nr:hypothetical protein [Prevotella pallens]MBF1480870.1 hypothetical protein [Prevotella pallens]
MVKRKYEYDESAPTAGGVFVVYFVGIYGLFGEQKLPFRNTRGRLFVFPLLGTS